MPKEPLRVYRECGRRPSNLQLHWNLRASLQTVRMSLLTASTLFRHAQTIFESFGTNLLYKSDNSSFPWTHRQEFAEWGLRNLLLRAIDLGASEPHHYLLPFDLRKSRVSSKTTTEKWDVIQSRHSANTEFPGFLLLNQRLTPH